MRTPSPWRGVRLCAHLTGPDPDAPARQVFIPAGWAPEAAAALAALAPDGAGPLRLPQAVEAWTRRFPAPLAEALHRLLLTRRAAPDAALWQGRTDAPVRFVLNLSAFAVPGEGFDLPGFRDALTTVAAALAALPPAAPVASVGFADLAGLLAALGVVYDSPEAREIVRGLAALLRARLSGPPLPVGAAGPARTTIPGLAEAARDLSATPGPAVRAVAALAAPGPAEALLGVETGGIAPAFGPLRADGTLSRAARAWLAATGRAPEQALADVLAGQNPFPAVSAAAATAMAEAVAPFVLAPQGALPAPAAALPSRRDLPARRAGYTQRASIGGHRLYLSTGQYADGTLGEISVALHKESPAIRGLMDSLCTAVSLGLQHGVPLDAFVEAFVQTSFGPAGEVEGDPAVPAASSLVDYLARHLAATYLARTDLPPPRAEPAPAPAPSLPLDLPAGRRRLRVVG
jgi:ribonucleoside-diphosphate reductase alpha chain